MAQFADQLAGIGRTQLEAFLKAAELASESAHKLADVNLEVLKESYADTVAALKKAQATKEAGEFANAATTSLQPVWDKTTRYAKAVYGVVSTTQAELAQLVEQQLAEVNKGVVGALDSAVKSAPAGSESVFNAFKSGLHAANEWYDTVAKAARQAVATTEANLSAAAGQVAAAAKKKVA